MVKQAPRSPVSSRLSSSPPPETSSLEPSKKQRRPKGESKISTRKIRILLHTPLFYHQHRVALINANFLQYQKDPKKEMYKYIGQKLPASLSYPPLLDLFLISPSPSKNDLQSLILTALTLKNTETRHLWQHIYLHVGKRVVRTGVEEVNGKSKMVGWCLELERELRKEEFFKVWKGVRGKMPVGSEVVRLAVKEGCCMLARYCHFKENVCEEVWGEEEGKGRERK